MVNFVAESIDFARSFARTAKLALASRIASWRGLWTRARAANWEGPSSGLCCSEDA